MMEFLATCDAILIGTFLQPTNPPHTHLDMDTSECYSASSTDSDDSMNSPTGPNDKTETVATPGHPPLHLQRETLPNLVQLLIDSFCYTTAPNVVTPEITEKEYKAKLKAWDETTSTSSTSNMHLGHLKAYWANHTLPNNSNEARELTRTRNRILEGHLILLNYALKCGYSYNEWKHIVNIMLKKDKGLPKIHRLCVIHLYEADYNLIL